jgi:branched-chain amino acid transport system ATP-binding protein
VTAADPDADATAAGVEAPEGGPETDGDPRDAALGTVGLTRKFGELVAVDHVDLAVPAGELRAIIGPNGAGKTTLFNVITGALAPTDGTVWFDGTDVTGREQYERPHLGLARSFQANELFTKQTVLENVRVVVQTTMRGSFGFDLFRRGDSVGVDRALEVLELLDLDDKRDDVANTLPHGDQRRLGIAMALATEPDVLLLDEPTSGMGPSETQSAARLVEEIHERLNLTILLIEHDMDIVLSISDRITVLNRGAAIATGTPAEVQADDAVQEAYLAGVREEL